MMHVQFLKARKGNIMNLKHTRCLLKYNFNPNNFIFIKGDWESFTFRERKTGKILVCRY